jgi:signal transduction histidine kinase
MKFIRPANIRTRLALWYLVILASILTIYIVVVFTFQYALLKRQIFHDEIQDVETVEGLMYFDALGKVHLREDYHSHPQSRLLEDRLMEVHDLSGNLLYRSDSLKGEMLGGASWPDEGANSYSQRSIQLNDGTRVLLISHLHPLESKLVLIRLGYSMAPLHERMLYFFWILLLATPFALVLAGFAGYSIARRALRPLDQMARRAEQITANNLHDRITVENPHDELGHMARVLNHLLERLQQSFIQLQRFTADAAHELRTPLAALRNTGEVTLQAEIPEEGYRNAIGSMLEETMRLNQTIDALLLLAKAETSRFDDLQTSFLLTELVDEILALLDVLIEERHITIEHEGKQAATEPIFADRSLIRIAFLNVLHNAIKFSPDNSILKILYSRKEGDRSFQRVCIQDSGPGIASGEHQRVFERFFTSNPIDRSAHSGAGLGLSISKLIIDRNGGKIYFNPAIAHGATCCIELPLHKKDLSSPAAREKS